MAGAPGPVTVSIFRGTSPYAGSEVTLPWAEFVAGLPDLLQETRPSKLELPAITCCAFRDGYRSNATTGDHTALLIDVDACEADALLAACARWTCAVYESPSSTYDAPRFRVIAALAEPYPAHAVAEARSAFARALGLDPLASGVAKAAAPAQLYFAGQVEGTRPRAVVSFDGEVWTPPPAGEAPELHDGQGEATEPLYGPDHIPDLAPLVQAILPDPADPLQRRRGGRDVSRAIGGYLARQHFHPEAIYRAVFEQIPSDQPDVRAELARETAEQYYSGDPRAAGYTTLLERFGEDVVEAQAAALVDPADRAWIERTLARRVEPAPLPLDPPAAGTDAHVGADAVLGALPGWVREHVLAAREELRTPVDLNLANALGVLSSAVAGRLRVRIHSNYAAHTCLFVCSVAPPGELKSPAFRLATAPIKSWVAERQEAERETFQREMIRRAALEAEQKRLEKDHFARYAEGEDAPEHSDLLRIRLQLASPPPVLFEYLIEDATPEALANLLATHGRIACFSSDAAKVFRIMSGRYSDGQADLGAWLEAYDGSTPKVHRVGRKAEEPRHTQTTLSAVLSIQPQVLETVTGNAALVGEGLVQRFCWVVCEKQGPRWAPGELPAPMPKEVAEAWHDGVRRLLDTPAGAEVRLSTEAASAYVAWRDELEHRLHKGDLGDDMSGWTSKHLERTARIAAVLWAAEGAVGDRITGEQMARAVTIGRWLIPHAIRALRGSETDTQEERLLQVVSKLCKRAGGAVTKRDIQRNAPRPLRNDSKALALRLENLVERGLLELQGKAYALP